MSQDAAGLIGIVGQDNQGLEGIELGFNHLLQGKNGLRVYQKDGSGAVIGVIKNVDPVPPPNVTLSIDKFIPVRVVRANSRRRGGKPGRFRLCGAGKSEYR
jgi:cell division protein FtsI (penicillin-binding protein 3)